MHYKNGREVKVGDKVVGRGHNGNPISGIVIEHNAQSDACNIAIVPCPDYISCSLMSKEFLHVDDALPKDPSA